MAVYLVQAGENGPVKIGFAASITHRMVKMQADNHEPLRLLRAFEGGQAEEAALHTKFARLHIRGEWFAFDPAMLGDLDLPEIRGVARDVIRSAYWDGIADRKASNLARYIARPGNSASKLAEDCGVATTTISRLARGDTGNPRLALIRKIIHHTGGELSFADLRGDWNDQRLSLARVAA